MCLPTTFLERCGHDVHGRRESRSATGVIRFRASGSRAFENQIGSRRCSAHGNVICRHPLCKVIVHTTTPCVGVLDFVCANFPYTRTHTLLYITDGWRTQNSEIIEFSRTCFGRFSFHRHIDEIECSPEYK